MFSKNKLAPMTERSLSTKAVRQYEYQHEDNDSDEFEHLDKLIMSELKADNERMAKKIQ